jgi:trans-aconitate methyltransferase
MYEWDAEDYHRHSRAQEGWARQLMERLGLQGHERVLDIGSGDGKVTAEMARRVPRGHVVGVDSAPRMVAFAREHFPAEAHPNLRFETMDARSLSFEAEFDLVFSNATLHWVLDKERAARAIWFALKPGGRFAGEMGGQGNLAKLRQALDDELVARGFGPPTYAANWYPSPEEFTALYEQAGFKDIDARLIERPTQLQHGVAAWVTTFRAGWLDRAGVPQEERQSIADAVAERVGTDMADYVRLRFMMRKPN